MLKMIGVDGEHIKKMQCKILQEDRDRYQDFPDLATELKNINAKLMEIIYLFCTL